jgi:glycosyltransferase involved in cell wall biosynthesis
VLERSSPARFTVWGAPSGSAIPGPRLFGRHWRWPGRVRRSGAQLFFGPAGQLPLRGIGCPTVITVHDLAIYIRPEWFPAWQPLSTRLVVPRSISHATAIIAVSENTRADVERVFGISGDRVKVVPEGVSARFRPLPAEALDDVRRRYSLPDRFLLFVSTLEPRKNLPTLLDAWEGLPRSRRQPLVLAGGWGWRADPIRARVERIRSGLHVIGPVDPGDLPALYNLAGCLVHPAWYEGFGLTPLEAMACGTPVVCSDAASLPEVVGEAALLVAPGDVDGWRQALERVLDDAGLARRLRAAGLARAAEFTWERAANATWEVFTAAARA